MNSKPINLDNQQEVEKLLSSIDYVLTDCDGVIYLNNSVVPGTPETLNLLRANGKKIIFASNNSSKSRKSVLTKLNKMGFNATLDEVIVSSFVVGRYLKSIDFKEKVYVFGCSGVKDELDEMNIENDGVGPDPFPESFDTSTLVPPITLDPSIRAVVVAFDSLISLPKLIKVCTYASRVKPELFIATNGDESFPTNDPQLLVPGTGAFVNFVKTAVSREPIFMGKPGTIYWDAIKSLHPNIDPSRTLMIGDRLNTDIAFGNQNNLGYTLLVESGVHTMERDVIPLLNQNDSMKESKLLIPTHYLKKLSDLNVYLEIK